MSNPELDLNELEAYLTTVDFPITHSEAIAVARDVTLRYADGAEPFAAVVRRCESERFESRDDLLAEVYANLPTEAVGEPGQSEGDA